MIVVIPFSETDWQRAERLCDAIYWIGGKKPIGHCLLVADNAVHQEYRLKVKLAAEVAFASVDSTEVGIPHTATKTVAINTTFRHACHYVFNHYREPWLWLEADNVPLKANWLKELFRVYEKQPRRYMGRFMQAKSGNFLSRTAIYPQNAVHDLDNACKGEPPFERIANILPRCTNTGLIHMEKWTRETVLPETVGLLNGDRNGILIEQLIAATDKRKKVMA